MGVETQNEGFTAPGPAALKSSFSAFDYVSNELLTLRLDKMDGIGGMFVMIPLVYATKNVEWTDERILYARIAFGVVQALIVVVLLMVKSKISKAASETKITVPKAAPSPWSQRFVLSSFATWRLELPSPSSPLAPATTCASSAHLRDIFCF